MTAYDVALAEWGARQLEQHWAEMTAHKAKWSRLAFEQDRPATITIDRSSVTVSFEFDEGYQTGSSMDTSARAEVRISGRPVETEDPPPWPYGESTSMSIEPDDFDFTRVLSEIVTAGGGAITA